MFFHVLMQTMMSVEKLAICVQIFNEVIFNNNNNNNLFYSCLLIHVFGITIVMPPIY